MADISVFLLVFPYSHKAAGLLQSSFLHSKLDNGRKGHVSYILNFLPVKLKLTQILEILTAEFPYVSVAKIGLM